MKLSECEKGYRRWISPDNPPVNTPKQMSDVTTNHLYAAIDLAKERDLLYADNQALRTQLKSVEAGRDRLNAIVLDYENREASVCPENTPFEDVIKRLKGEVEVWRKEVEGSASGATLTTIKNLITERDKAVSTLATYKAAVVEAREVLDLVNLRFDDETSFLTEGGKAFQSKVINALHTLSALTCDATKTP